LGTDEGPLNPLPFRERVVGEADRERATPEGAVMQGKAGLITAAAANA
jgi:hypothetical protein